MQPVYYFLFFLVYFMKEIESDNSGIADKLLYSRYGSHDRYSTQNPEDIANLPHSWSDDRCNGILRDDDREVATNFGRVRGKRVLLCDGPGFGIRQRPGQDYVGNYKIVNVYLGIPYAEPPTRRNNLQFKPPQYPRSWTVISALHYKPSCPQHQDYLGLDKGYNITDEDCLYLNIYTPTLKSVQAQGYPVMVYIHGGNFDHGSANIFPAHMLAAQDVIVITFNYRLGHLGFLSTGNEDSVGNYGILDQVLALKWVYENIESFNGDRESITLFGSDAGAASATLLAMSPLSKHMVKRVIAQNGAPVADWATITDPLFAYNTSRVLGEYLGCTSEVRLLVCVGKRSNNEIKILKVKPVVGWLPWGPIVDNFTSIGRTPFLPKSPQEMLTKGNPFRRDFSIMTGTSRDEGVNILLADPVLKKAHYRFTPSILEMKIREFMNMYNYSVNSDGIFGALHFMYGPSLDSKNESLLRQAYIDLLTDRYYKAPNYMMGKMLVAHDIPLYMYVSNYTFEAYRPANSWQGISSEMEYLLLTGAPFLPAKYLPPYFNLEKVRWTEADRDMSAFYIQAWANFAKTGNPTRSRVNSILWEPTTKENFAILDINSTESNVTRYLMNRMVRDYKERESEFWNCYLPFLIGREPPTLAPTLEPGIEELRVVTSALYGTVAAAIIFIIATVVLCILYCRIRRDSDEGRCCNCSDGCRTCCELTLEFFCYSGRNYMP